MPYCTNCGKQLNYNDRFCSGCGSAVEQNQENTNRKTVYEGEIHKCPNCGEVINSFVSICPVCGFELNSRRVSTILQDFIKEINECAQLIANSPQAGKTGWTSWSKSKRVWWIILNVFFLCIPLAIYVALPLVMVKFTPNLTAEEQRMASLVENFPFPNDRESILSALVFTKEKIDFISKETANRKTAYWMRLWCAKAEQLKQKADLLFPNDPIVKESYAEIVADETRVNKKLRMKAIIGLVILVVAVVYAIIWYGSNLEVTNSKDYNATFEWQTTGLFAEMPEPDTNNGKIIMETDNQINIELYNISSDEFEVYVKKCRDEGFTKEVTKTDDVFYATDENGYDLNLFYDSKKDVLSIHISAYDLNEVSK